MKTMIPVIKIINRSPIRAIFNILHLHRLSTNRNVRVITTCSNSKCNIPLEFPVRCTISTPSPRNIALQIRCFACQNIFLHAFYPGQVPSSSISNNKSNTASRSGLSPPPNAPSGSSQLRKGRKIGTQERPLETGYYDILGVPINATTEDIKKSYSESKLSASLKKYH